MARMTRQQQQAQAEAELQARLTAEHKARMAAYDFWTGVKDFSSLCTRPFGKVWNWTPAIVIGPAEPRNRDYWL